MARPELRRCEYERYPCDTGYELSAEEKHEGYFHAWSQIQASGKAWPTAVVEEKSGHVFVVDARTLRFMDIGGDLEAKDESGTRKEPC